MLICKEAIGKVNEHRPDLLEESVEMQDLKGVALLEVECSIVRVTTL
jgi:hypothetical protein